MELPKYVEKDLTILYNYEFARDRFGYEINNSHKIAKKLFNIAEKYPQKYLSEILEYFGYFYGEEELAEEDYRDEILYLAEQNFLKAMNDPFLMYDEKVNNQIPFIELGLIDCWYGSAHRFRASDYIKKYAQKSVDN